jgi:hypothetical protein
MTDGSVEGLDCGFHALTVPSEDADITVLRCQHDGHTGEGN